MTRPVYGRSLLGEARRLADGGAPPVLATVAEWWRRLPAILVVNAALVAALGCWWLLARVAGLAGFAVGAVAFAGCWGVATIAVRDGSTLRRVAGRAAVRRSIGLAGPWLIAVIDVRLGASAGAFPLLCVVAVAALCTWFTQVAFVLAQPGETLLRGWRQALVRTGLQAMPALGLIVLGGIFAAIVISWSALAIGWLPGLWLVAAVVLLRDTEPERGR
jgi:hypothetical protein